MQSRRIKFPDDLVAEIEKEKQTLSAFVREAVEAELRRRHPKRRYKFPPVRQGRPKETEADV